MRRAVKLWVLCWAGAAVAASSASDELGALVARADRIVLARVVSTRVSSSGRLLTTAVLEVEEHLKGAPGPVHVVQLGGTRGGWTSQVAGASVLREGERALLFLSCPQALAPSCVLAAPETAALPVRGDRVSVGRLGPVFGESLTTWLAGLRRWARAQNEASPSKSTPRGAR